MVYQLKVRMTDGTYRYAAPRARRISAECDIHILESYLLAFGGPDIEEWEILND